MARSMRVLCTLALLAAWGCDDNPTPDAGVDGALEAEMGPDAAPVDGGPDGALDALTDAALDRGIDPDGEADAGDARPDALPDMLPDALPDALPDVLADTLPDALPDVLADTLPDAVIDPDVGEDAAIAPDVGPPPELDLGLPPAPLLVVFESPANGRRFAAGPIAVAGRVGLPIDGLTVAGEAVEPDGAGRFAADVALVEGENVIVARATRDDAAAEARITVVLDTVGPAVTVDDPADGALIAADRVAVQGEAGDAARVTVNGAPAVVADGRYAVTVALDPGPNRLEAVALDDLGNVGRAAVEVVRDSVAPVVRIDAPADGAVLAAEAVEVRGAVDDAAATATLNGDPLPLDGGAFAADAPLVEGPNRLTVVALDAAGNRGAATVVITRDTTAPLLVVDQPLDGALLAAETARFSGSVDDRAAALTVAGDAAPISPAGLWAVDVPLVEGENAVAVAAVDAVGNRRALTVRVVRDTTPPDLTIDAPAEDAVIAAEAVELRGAAEPGAALTVGGEPVAVGADGAWSVELPVVRGVNAAVAVATDAAGNQRRVERRFVGDRDGPGLQVTAPAPATLTRAPTIDVEGTVLDPEASVRVNGAPAAVVDGRFSAGVALVEGANTITVVATDPAGNADRVEVPVTRDSTPPALTVDTPLDGAVVRAPAVVIRGAVEPGALLTLSLGGAPLAPAVDGGGFSAGAELAPGANLIVAEAEDAAGNRRRVEVRVALDDQPPGLWIDSPSDGAVVGEGTVRVVGRASAAQGDGARIEVGGVLADVVDGRFAVDVPLAPGPNLIAAVAARRATAITVVRDVEAPWFTVVGDAADGLHDRSQVDVLGRVVDRAADGPVQVWVDGRPAAVVADGFAARDVALQIGANTLAVVVEDAVGNRRSAEIDVRRVERRGQSLLRVGGLHQRGIVGAPLPAPLVVLARDVYGEPLVGAELTFEVIGGDGRLDAFPAQGRAVNAITDAAGLARVGFTLGGRAGHGAHRVRVRGSDGGPALGQVTFAPAALPGPATSVVISAGQRQAVTAGDDLRFTLRVTDAFGNPVSDTPVAISAVEGVDFDGAQLSGPDGRVRLVVPTVVPGPVTLRATVGDAQTPLLATAEAAADGATRVVGRLIDESDAPLAGLTVFAALAEGPALATTSDGAGRFALDVPPGAVMIGVEAPGRFAEMRSVLARPGVDADIGPWTLPAVPAVTEAPARIATLAGASLDGAEGWGVVRASDVPPPDGAVPALTTAVLGEPAGALCLPALGVEAGAVRDIVARVDGRWGRLGTATAVDDPALGLRLCTDDGMGPARAGIYGVATLPPAPSCPASCDDGDPCTAGRCVDGRCVQAPLDAVDCGDGCRTARCVAGVCVVEEAAPDGTRCDDGDACTTDTVCVEGVCSGAAVECPADGCTIGACDPAVGCVQTPRPDGARCADDPCGACRGGACVAGGVACPAVDDPCLAAACDPETGACAAVPVADDTPCGDAACGFSFCRDGVCTTDDAPPAACDDGDACTTDDACVAGRCVGQGPPVAAFAPDGALFERPLTAVLDRVELLLARHPPFVAAFGEALRFDVAGERRDCCGGGARTAGGAVEARAGWRRVARLNGALDGLAREVELAGPGARVTVALTVEAALDLTLAGAVEVSTSACDATTCSAVDAGLAATGGLGAAARVVACVAETPGACDGLSVSAGALQPAISGQCRLRLGPCAGDAPPPCTVTIGPLPVAVTLVGPAGRTVTPVSLYRP